MTNVPASYVSLIQQMSAATGIPYAVIAAQANDESGFNAQAVSSAGAEGWLQFLPSTYNGVAAQAGVPPGSEFNAADEAKAYDVYMKQLLAQEGGNVQNALAAYNAGPGNISAGQGYASGILTAAGERSNVVAGPAAGTGSPQSSGSGINLVNPLTWTPTNILKTVFGGIFGISGIGADITDILERGALMLFGAVLVVIGIIRLSGGSPVEKAKGAMSQPDEGGGNLGRGEEVAEEAAPEAIAA